MHHNLSSSPVRVLAGEGEAAVPKADEVMFFVVDVGGISPVNLPELDLQVVEELREASAVENLIGYVNQLQEDPDDYSGGVPTLRGLQKVASLVKKGVETIEIVHHERGRRAEAVFTPLFGSGSKYCSALPKKARKQSEAS